MNYLDKLSLACASGLSLVVSGNFNYFSAIVGAGLVASTTLGLGYTEYNSPGMEELRNEFEQREKWYQRSKGK